MTARFARWPSAWSWRDPGSTGEIYHLTGELSTSRFDWVRSILRGVPVAIEPMRLEDYVRRSRVPARAVLDASRAAALGIAAFDWRDGRAPNGKMRSIMGN